MHYNSLKSAIPKSWVQTLKTNIGTTFNKTDSSFKVKIRGKLKHVIKVTNKDYYWEFIRKIKDSARAIITWGNLYCNFNFDWKEIFKIPYLCARESKIQSMQYQILNRYFPCGNTLNTWYKTNSYVCIFCGMSESIEHYFYTCDIIKDFWTSFRKWWKNIYECDIELSVCEVIFGVPNEMNDIMIDCLNFCILYAKQFIVEEHSDGSNKSVFIYEFAVSLKNRLEVEKLIAKNNGNLNLFKNKWCKIYENM